MYTSYTNNTTSTLTERVSLSIISVENFHITELLHIYPKLIHKKFLCSTCCLAIQVLVKTTILVKGKYVPNNQHSEFRIH